MKIDRIDTIQAKVKGILENEGAAVPWLSMKEQVICLLLKSAVNGPSRQSSSLTINCRARSLKKVEDIRTDLGIGVANPVRWYEATTLMFELGARLFVEVGTGQILANMLVKHFQLPGLCL